MRKAVADVSSIEDCRTYWLLGINNGIGMSKRLIDELTKFNADERTLSSAVRIFKTVVGLE